MHFFVALRQRSGDMPWGSSLSRGSSSRSSRGGAVLGEGGQGRVSTIGDLPDAISRCPFVTLVTVNLLDAQPQAQRTRCSTDKVLIMTPFAAFKADITDGSRLRVAATNDVRNEFELTERLVLELARDAASRDGTRGSGAKQVGGRDRRTGRGDNNAHRRRLAADLGRLTALLVLRGRVVVIGVIADACVPPGGARPSYHPMYRRMDGSLRDLSKDQPGGLTLRQLTGAVAATLDAMALLDRCGARHGDVKEHNVLYATRPSGATRYALCDFGYLRFPSDHLTPEGTEGSTSPLLFDPHMQAEFLADYILKPELADAAQVWASYAHELSDARRRPVAEQSLKNDLYAVGVMLGHVAVQEPLPHPLRDLVRGLLAGSGTGAIWTLAQARSALRKMLRAAAAPGGA